MPSPGHVRLIDVAKAAHVAITTASGILNGSVERQASFASDTRQRVLEAAQRIGYVRDIAAQRLRAGRTGTIGVVMNQPLKDPAYAAIVESIERELHGQDYRMLLGIVGLDGPERQIQCMLAERVEGLLFGAVYERRTLKDWWQRIPVPLVLFGGRIGIALDEVAIDFDRAARLAADHLRDLGHRRIGFIRATPQARAALHRSGIAADPAWMVDNGLQSHQLDEVFAHVQDVVRKWTHASAEARPTAFICRDDQTAKMAISILHGAGFQVPEDVSLVGMGNVADSAYLAPPLTTIDLKATQRATLAVQTLLTRISAPTRRPAVQWVEPVLVRRASVRHVR